MKPKYKNIKIVLNHPTLSAKDLEDLQRWEDEGGAPGNKPDILSSLSLEIPIKKKQIFEVVGSEIVLEDGQLYLKADLNILALH